MKVTLDQNMIQMIDLFHNLTGSSAMDCIQEEDCVYFVVAAGQYGLAVGKNGAKVKNAERVFKRPIKVFEYADNVNAFVKNLVPDAQEITQNGKTIVIKISPKDRARVIGKAGKNIKIINRFLQRLFDIEELKVK